MASENVTANAGTGNKRIITLDIETISTDPQNPDGALGAGRKGEAVPGETSQIAIIGMLIEEGGRLKAVPIFGNDERKLLQTFWGMLRADDLLVVAGGRKFDGPRLAQRSWLLGVKPSVALNLAKYRDTNLYDVIDRWGNWDELTGCSLDNLARALGVGRKTGNGAEVQELWLAGKHREAVQYCLNDCWLAYQVFCRMNFRDPLPIGQPVQEPIAAPVYQAPIPKAAPRPEPTVLPFRIPETQPAARPVYVNQQTAGQYRMVADGRGGLMPVMDDPRPVEVVGFAAAAQVSPQVAPSTPMAPRPAVPQAAAPRRPSRAKRVMWVERNGRLVLTGKTYEIREGLLALGGQRSKQGEEWIWEVGVEKYDAVAGLCSRNGMSLVAAQAPAA